MIDKKTEDYIIECLKTNQKWRIYQLKQWRGKDGLRVRALKRDNFECQDCKEAGRYKKAVDVHHIVEVEENPRLFLELNNLISLCKDCHNKRHNRQGGKSKKPKFLTPERW